MKTKMKVYRVVSRIGRKCTIIFESAAFDPTDGCADYDAYKSAIREREAYCMKLWGEGYSVTIDGRYHHIGKDLEAGKIEVYLYTK